MDYDSPSDAAAGNFTVSARDIGLVRAYAEAGCKLWHRDNSFWPEVLRIHGRVSSPGKPSFARPEDGKRYLPDGEEHAGNFPPLIQVRAVTGVPRYKLAASCTLCSCLFINLLHLSLLLGRRRITLICSDGPIYGYLAPSHC